MYSGQILTPVDDHCWILSQSKENLEQMMERPSGRSEQMGAAQKDHRFRRGRQIAFLIYEYFLVTRTHEAALDFSDLFSITQRGDDVEGFDTRWDEVLLSTHEVPSDAILESLYKMQIRESDQFKTVLALYE